MIQNISIDKLHPHPDNPKKALKEILESEVEHDA